MKTFGLRATAPRRCRTPVEETTEETADVNTDVMNAIATGVSTISLILVGYQIRQANLWNRRQSPFNFVDTDKGRVLESQFDEALKALGIDLMVRRNRPLTGDEIAAIRKLGTAATAVNHFINDLQNLCAALRYKLVDESVFRSMHAGRIRWWYQLLAPYVAAMRVEFQDPRLWEDFEKVAKTTR